MELVRNCCTPGYILNQLLLIEALEGPGVGHAIRRSDTSLTAEATRQASYQIKCRGSRACFGLHLLSTWAESLGLYAICARLLRACCKSSTRKRIIASQAPWLSRHAPHWLPSGISALSYCPAKAPEPGKHSQSEESRLITLWRYCHMISLQCFCLANTTTRLRTCLRTQFSNSQLGAVASCLPLNHVMPRLAPLGRYSSTEGRKFAPYSSRMRLMTGAANWASCMLPARVVRFLVEIY